MKHKGRKSAEKATAKISDYFVVVKKRKADNPRKVAPLLSEAEESDKENRPPTKETVSLPELLLPSPSAHLQDLAPALKRIRLSPEEEQQSRSFPEEVSRAELGDFGKLPRELLFVFFDLIPVSLVGRLALCSKRLSKEAWTYFRSKAASRRFGERESRLVQKRVVCHTCKVSHGCSLCPPDTYKQWGFLLKRLTILHPTKQRIVEVHRFYDTHYPDTVLLTMQPAILQGWGSLFMAVMRNWDTYEMGKVYTEIMGHSNSLAFLRDTFLSSVPGNLPEIEYRLRVFHRSVFLDQSFYHPEDGPFWLSRILAGLSLEQKGKLIGLLATETKKKGDGTFVVDWRSLCDVAVTSHANAFRRLKLHLQILNMLSWKDGRTGRGHWTNMDIFMLVEEITTFPEPWAMDNFAALLLMVPNVAKPVLVSRIASGHIQETAAIFTAIKNLVYRWDLGLKGVLSSLLTDCFGKCKSRTDRISFLGELVHASLAHHSELQLQNGNNNNNGSSDLFEERGGFRLLMDLLRSVSYLSAFWLQDTP